MSHTSNHRKGILCGGNWIVDHVKIIDTYPSENMLVDILDEFVSVGGGPNNVLTNLAKLNADIPLYAMGLIGDDQDGEFIFHELSKYKIDVGGLKKTDLKRTSYTDVMSVSGSGNRTFFHYRGTNSLLDIHDFEIQSDARIFHLAYLLLLDKLDAIDDDYGVVAARVLENLQKGGYETSVDVVSSEGGRFKTIIGPCLPYIDYLIINEIEAGLTTGRKIRSAAGNIDTEQLHMAAHDLIRAGTKKKVIIHFPEGGLVLDRNGDELLLPSFEVSDVDIKGTTGAGDAFCAACLYAIHEGYDHERMLKFAHACASFNLQNPTSTGGAVTIGEIDHYIESASLRPSVT
jgi:sugar/nucleoside kinase (ribokinase family)